MRGFRILLIITVILCSLVALNPASAQQQTHTVQPGENLFRIALRYNVTVEALVAANHLSDATHIVAGQVLIIPGTDTNPASSNPVAPASNPGAVAPPPVASNSPVYYVVQPGDTLNAIGRQFGVTAQAILSANGLADANHIEVGQRLIIPGGNGSTGNLPGLPSLPSGQATSVPPTPIPPTAAVAPTAAPPVTNQASYRTHTVQPGQGLAEIARLYNVNWPDIAALNGITDPNRIFAGTVLKIPINGANPTTLENSLGVPPGPITSAITDGSTPQAAEGKNILVVLHEQKVYAYEDGKLVRNLSVSTGLPGTPTVLGTYHIYIKYSAQLMVGPGYYLPGVPWVMYFFQGYALHGAYWHHNWGHPMSHGCVNMPTDEAAWFYQWAPIGTPVTVVA